MASVNPIEWRVYRDVLMVSASSWPSGGGRGTVGSVAGGTFLGLRWLLEEPESRPLFQHCPSKGGQRDLDTRHR